MRVPSSHVSLKTSVKCSIAWIAPPENSPSCERAHGRKLGVWSRTFRYKCLFLSFSHVLCSVSSPTLHQSSISCIGVCNTLLRPLGHAVDYCTPPIKQSWARREFCALLFCYKCLFLSFSHFSHVLCSVSSPTLHQSSISCIGMCNTLLRPLGHAVDHCTPPIKQSWARREFSSLLFGYKSCEN